MYYDPSLPFNDFADCLGNFKVVHRSYTFYTQTTFICKNPDLYILYSNTPQLKWKCQSTKISWGQSLMIKDLHRFIKHFVIKYHGIIWNSEEGKSEQSLILNLNPSPSEKICVKSCIFCAKTNQFYSIFSEGGPQTPPLIHIFHSFLTLCWKKRRNKEVQTNSRIKNDLLNPITYPPPFFFACWNLRSEVRTPPPPTLMEKKFWIGVCMHSTQFFKTDFHMVSGDHL